MKPYAQPSSPGAGEANESPSENESPSRSAVMDFVSELVEVVNDRKLYREVTLALRVGLRDAVADFSFLRVQGLRCLLKFLHSVANSDSMIHLFCLTQSLPDLQVVPVLFQHSLKEVEEIRVTNLERIFTVEPMKLASPSTNTEVALALRVLEGCCLVHRQSTIFAHQHKAIPVLMKILSSRGVQEQGACLDALIALILDSTSNQMDFEACNGIGEVAAIIRDKQVDENVRMKCGEFLLLLIAHVDSSEMQPMATIHNDLRRLLGEKPASLVWAASQFGSTLDPEERMTALHIQARRVLESLDLFGV